jgi:hypothetical protein
MTTQPTLILRTDDAGTLAWRLEVTTKEERTP